jgi:hypothetical protein
MFPTLSPARRRIVVWLLLGALALIILAGGLGSFTFQQGKMYSWALPELGTAESSTGFGGGEELLTFLRGALALLLLLLPVSIVLSLLTKEGRRRLLINIILAILVFMVADRVKEMPKREAEQMAPEIAAPAKNPADGGEPLPPPPPAPSEEFVMIASIGLVAAGVALAAWLGRGLLFPRPLPPLVQIAMEADRARNTLSSGGAVEDAIIRAYRQMSRTLAEGRKLVRQQTMTPHEFEEYLAAAGLPRSPVQVLTHLFEDVRYGGLVAGAAERQAAIDSLTAIAAACRKDKDKE